MKVKLLIFASILFFAGCSKSKITDKTKSDESAIRVKSVAATSEFQSRTQKFSLLTPAEKFQLWQGHILNAKAQFLESDERRKVASIDQLLANLTVEVFDESSTGTSDIFLNYFMPVWSSSAANIFTEQEIYDITFNPAAQVIGRFAPEDIGGGLPGGGPNCFCHIGASGFSCRRLTISIPPSITNGICERTAADCEGSSRGCGWVWLQSCYGNHCQF